MHISSMVHLRPEDELWEVLEGQKTVRTTKLKNLIEPLLNKVRWQEETLKRNVQSIRTLNDRAQRVEAKLKWKNDVIERDSQTIRALDSRAQRAEDQLRRAKSVIAGMELDMRIAKQNGK